MFNAGDKHPVVVFQLVFLQTNIRGKLMLSQNVTNLSALFSSSKKQVIKSCPLCMSDHIGGATLELLALIAYNVISDHNVFWNFQRRKSLLDLVV